MNRLDTVVLATTNKGKVAELSELLNPIGLSVVGLDAFFEYPDVEETGTTFSENALLKARFAAQYTGLVSIADDSGLAVDALCGAPGIYSARYGADIPMLDGENRDDRNIRKLLEVMHNVPQEKRGAQFHCVMAAVSPNGTSMVCEGIWRGEILFKRQGINGFGYDPVFYDSSLGKTAAELTREEKSSVSHRGRATRELVWKWSDFWNDAML